MGWRALLAGAAAAIAAAGASQAQIVETYPVGNWTVEAHYDASGFAFCLASSTYDYGDELGFIEGVGDDGKPYFGVAWFSASTMLGVQGQELSLQMRYENSGYEWMDGYLMTPQMVVVRLPTGSPHRDRLIRRFQVWFLLNGSEVGFQLTDSSAAIRETGNCRARHQR